MHGSGHKNVQNGQAHPEGVLAPCTLICDDALNSVVFFYHVVAYHTKINMVYISVRKIYMNNQEYEIKRLSYHSSAVTALQLQRFSRVPQLFPQHVRTVLLSSYPLECHVAGEALHGP